MILSIVVPIYNVEKYIEKCLENILKIENISYEVIIVLTKSEDNSENIAYKYEKYFNVSICYQDGKGLSNARNYGFNIAKGKYILFVDGDDYISSSILEEAIHELDKNKYDFLISEYIGFYDSTDKFRQSNQMKKIKEYMNTSLKIATFLEKKKCFWNVWRYIYSKSFLLENNVFFEENTYAEDIDYTTKVFLKSKKIYFFTKAYYYYRMNRENSLMFENNYKKIEDTINIIECSIKSIYDSDYRLKKIFYRQYIMEFILNTANVYLLENKNDIKKIKFFFKDKLYLLKIDKYIIASMFYDFIKIFGLDICFLAMSIIKKVKRIIKGKKNGIFKKIL